MANSWRDLIDMTLADGFDAKAYDPKKGRTAFLKVIETAKTQHANGSTKAPNRAWKAGGAERKGIRFTPKLAGQNVKLDGQAVIFVPEESFADFLDKLSDDVKAGGFDKEIKAALDAKGAGKSSSGSSSRKSSSAKPNDGLGDLRKSFGASIKRFGKSKEEAKAKALASGTWSEADIDLVLSEF